jgi:hypothetical protein
MSERMKRRLTPQEQVLIGLGALVVLLLVVYAVITGVTRDSFRAAKRALIKAQVEYKDAVGLHERYDRLGFQIEEQKRRIAQLDPNFDLLAFIDKVESGLNPPFEHKSVTSPIQREFAGKYTRTRVTYVYENKDLDEIRKFLYEIENPEHGIIISNVKLDLKDKDEGERFTMTITFSVVTELPGAH